jgi:hypothetical protein
MRYHGNFYAYYRIGQGGIIGGEGPSPMDVRPRVLLQQHELSAEFSSPPIVGAVEWTVDGGGHIHGASFCWAARH